MTKRRKKHQVVNPLTMNDLREWREPTEEEEANAPRVNGLTFWEAFGLAVRISGTGVDSGPLADYLASTAPLTNNDRLLLAHFIKALPGSLPVGARGPGRQKNEQRARDVEIARRVRARQAIWRKENPRRDGQPRKTVPPDKTREFIKEIIGPDCSEREFKNVERCLRSPSRL
jgi:hypothetical protein